MTPYQLDNILYYPTQAPIPSSGVDRLRRLADLAATVNKDSIKPIMQYVRRFQGAYQVAFIFATCGDNVEMINETPIEKWASNPEAIKAVAACTDLTGR